MIILQLILGTLIDEGMGPKLKHPEPRVPHLVVIFPLPLRFGRLQILDPCPPPTGFRSFWWKSGNGNQWRKNV